MPKTPLVLVAHNIPIPNESYPHAPQVNAQLIARSEKTIAKYHALWKELHSKQDADPEWFADWINRVPSIGCGCRRDLQRYIADSPVDYANFHNWSIRLHNWVNKKLGKPLWIEHDASLQLDQDQVF